MSAAECAHLIEKARAWLHPSRVVNHASSGDMFRLSTARTSSSCKVAAKGRTLSPPDPDPHPDPDSDPDPNPNPNQVAAKDDVVVRRAVQRAAYLTGLTPQHAEAVQVVHYQPAQEYRPHFDWFDGATRT